MKNLEKLIPANYYPLIILIIMIMLIALFIYCIYLSKKTAKLSKAIFTYNDL